MTFTYRGHELDSFFGLTDQFPLELPTLSKEKNLIHILWNCTAEPITFWLNVLPITLQPNQLTTATFIQEIRFEKSVQKLMAFSFNREFYCIVDHDHEVSCNGIIFFGTQEHPIITLNPLEKEKFEALLKVFADEFHEQDNIQGEMLQMLLKRLIIKTTRLAKKQLVTKELESSHLDIVRKFNVLVDLHFREKRQVADYADMLNKSPKTLSNLFAKYNSKSPVQIIQERTMLEAKKLLVYTDKTSKEIAMELGYGEVASFHKLFKKVTGQTPNQFKEEIKMLSQSA